MDGFRERNCQLNAWRVIADLAKRTSLSLPARSSRHARVHRHPPTASYLAQQTGKFRLLLLIKVSGPELQAVRIMGRVGARRRCQWQ